MPHHFSINASRVLATAWKMSYDEILRLLGKLGKSPSENFALSGIAGFLDGL